jgi:Tol biopolymer transport system component
MQATGLGRCVTQLLQEIEPKNGVLPKRIGQSDEGELMINLTRPVVWPDPIIGYGELAVQAGRAILNPMLELVALALHLFLGVSSANAQNQVEDPFESARKTLIGYTEFRTNLAGGRHPNVITMRAMVVRADGIDRHALAPQLTQGPNTWTQIAGWSPDGRTAIIGRGWESPENGAWEEKHKTFRFDANGWLYDMYLFDLAKGGLTNLTAVDRVSFYNSGLFFWPNDPSKLGFQALIDGNSHPFRMDRDGRNKYDLTKDSKEFAYGFQASPDGKRIAYHKSYQIFVANADGSKATHIKTGQSFNFAPQWSPDGSWLLFVSGDHYNCHPYVVRSDGSSLRKVADRSGYKGVVEFLDVPDFHGGSSDLPVWSADGKSIIYAAQVGDSVELFQTTLEGKTEQLTKSPARWLHYHPQPSRDGKWLVYGSFRDGVRQLYLMRLEDRRERRITDLEKGYAAMWPHLQNGSR